LSQLHNVQYGPVVDRTRRVAFVTGLLATETAGVVVLHRLGRVEGFALPRHAVGRWLVTADTEDLIAVVARLAGLALAWWLLIATVLSLARRVVPAWRRVHALDVVTPAALRRAFDRAVVVGLGASLGLAGIRPVGAATRSTPTARPRVDVPVVRTASPPPRQTNPAGAPAVVVPTALVAPTVVIVRPGDNLWLIATRALPRGDHEPGPAEIAPYWRRVISANAAALRSGDPNLIYPGERIVLPPAE
jgi:nucleoid-associated protein YgaU